MIFRLFLSCFGIKQMSDYWESLPLFLGWKFNLQAALHAGERTVCVQHVSYMFAAWCPAPYALSGSPCHRVMVPLWVSKEAEMAWKRHAICFCALWGFSEECPDCPLQSAAPYSLMLRETRHLRYLCHEHHLAFMPSIPRQLDCCRPDGTLRDTAVNQEHFTSPTVQSEQNQALPTKAQYGWRHSRGLPFVCNYVLALGKPSSHHGLWATDKAFVSAQTKGRAGQTNIECMSIGKPDERQ